MSELRNQTTLDDFLPKPEPAPAEGYDERGNLINPAQSASTGPARGLDIIAAEINAIKRQALGVVISAALEIGKRLIEARNQVPAGRWLEWLSASVDYSERKAQDLMRLYEGYGDNVPDAIASLSYTQALQLLALPEDQRDAMAERAAGEGLSTRQLQAEIRRLNEAHAEAQQTIFSLSQQAEAAERAIRSRQEEVERAQAKAKAAEETAEGMRKVSSKAAEDAARAARNASDAVQRANDVTAENARLKARLAELEARAPEVAEVLMPDAEARRQIEALRAEIERLQTAGATPSSPDAGADQRRLALALRVRLAAQDCARALGDAVSGAITRAQAIASTLEQLRALDHARAASLTDEVWALQAMAEACRRAKLEYDEATRRP